MKTVLLARSLALGLPLKAAPEPLPLAVQRALLRGAPQDAPEAQSVR